jgi:hypothetical protein
MTINTKEALVDRIGQDYIWRLREISELKRLIEAPETSDIRKKVLCRSGIALLYAHWEGFVKKTGTYFLEFVANQRLSIAELKGNFVVLLVRKQLERASESNKYSAFDEVVNYILDNQNSRARIPVKNVVETRSNLSTTVLKEIVWCLGLDYEEFKTKERLIDLKLVGRRNHVAHGEVIEVGVDDFFEMADEVLGLMNLFRNLLENSATMKQYKAA